MLALNEKELIATAFFGAASPNEELRYQSMMSSFKLDLFKYKLQ